MCLRVASREYLVKDDPNFDPAPNYHICREKHTIKICHVRPNTPLLARHHARIETQDQDLSQRLQIES